MKAATSSIRWRLTVWFGLLLAAVLAGFGLTAYQLNFRTELAHIDEALAVRVSALQGDLRSPPPSLDRGPAPRGEPSDGGLRRQRPRPPGGPDDVNGPGGPPGGAGPGAAPPPRRGGGSGVVSVELSARTAALFEAADPLGYYHALWGWRGSPLLSSTNAPKGMEYPNDGSLTAGRVHFRTRAGFREAIYLTERADCVLAGVSLERTNQAARRFGWWLAAAGGLVLAAGLGVAWALTTRALRPIQAIGMAASRIAAGNLAERIPEQPASSELSELVAVLNATFARLDAAFQEQRNFTADASHELRTPLAAIITTLQTALARERTVEDYCDSMQACLRAAQQMRRLTESLLTLARFDAGQGELARDPVDLGLIVKDAAALVEPLAAARGVELFLEPAFAPVRGDAGRLSQVVNNLLVNAVHHGRDRGRIWVTTGVEGGMAVVRVVDDGPGIDPVDLPQVFKRFYRADKARSRESGRSGLGLAISSAVVSAHGGSMEARSAPGEGATFIVRIPAAAAC
jgi:two-component system OmpR family sensor kinase